jgi:cyclase
MDGLKKRIIPCLDVHQGRVVKGIHFKNLRDMGCPVALARHYQETGADELVFLDISASVENRGTVLSLVAEVAREVAIPFSLGGGLRSLSDCQAFLEAGADKVVVNSAALERPDLIHEVAKRYGRQCVVVAIDYAWQGEGYRVFSHGGKRSTTWQLPQWLQEVVRQGAGEVLLTSIDGDGTEQGFDEAVHRAFATTIPVPVIASGGAAHPRHFEAVFAVGADAGLAATMFHSGAYTVWQVKAYLAQQKINVRLPSPWDRRSEKGNEYVDSKY